MKNLKIIVKLLGGFIIVALIVLVVGFVGLNGARQLQGLLTEVGVVRLPSIQSLLVVSEAQTAVDSAENALLSRDISLEVRQEKYDLFDDIWKRADEAWNVYAPLPQSKEEEKVWNEFVPAWETWEKDHQTYVALSKEYDTTVVDLEKGNNLYMQMADQALIKNAVTFGTAEALLNQIVNIYHSLIYTRTSFTRVDILTVFTLLTISEGQTAIDSSENALLDRSGNLEMRQEAYDRIAGAWKRIDDAWEIYAPLKQTTAEAQIWKDFVPAWNAWKADHEAFVAFSTAYDSTVISYHKSNDIYNRMTEQALVENGITFTTAETLLTRIVEINDAIAKESQVTADAAAAQVQLIALIGMVAGLIISLILGIVLTLGITRPLVKGVAFAQEIALGDLDVTLDIDQKDEVGILADSLREMLTSLQYKGQMVEEVAKGNLTIDVKMASDNDSLGTSLIQMTDSLNKLLGEINLSVDQVNIGADQVSQASQTLSQGATESAASLEEVSASVTQINSQSRQNAENAKEANGLAKQATTDAEKGNKEMKGLSEAMTEINTSSDQIKKIVKVIDDIAFQTNLLALNANVEAARAGKYGKGFAVVADEVRNLAVRSAEAVKETTEMVDNSIRNIEAGNKAVEATATQLESIMGGSSKVADFLEEIATASNEQAEAIDQITQGLEQIDQVTQSNTASAEESAAAAEELASQSVQLKNMIATFKLKDSQTSPMGQPRQLEYKAAKENARIEHAVSNQAETGIKPADPAAVISLDDEDFDRF
jgi:methyl-accepting chemotaxis protein